MLQSRGVLVKSPTVQEFTPDSWNGWPQAGITTVQRWGSYAGMYRSQLWVSVLVNKRARATARLPLKVYERAARGRPEARDHPYAQLIAHPHPRLSPFDFWQWVSATEDIFGEAFLRKERDRAGRPVWLRPLHPTRVFDRDGDWFVALDDGSQSRIDRRDLIHFSTYNPDGTRGMSPLEPLRATLENEWGARVAMSGFWNNGARPSMLLKHPRTLTVSGAARLRAQWDALHGGADNMGRTAVLEEGMDAQPISLNADEMQYVESRRLNREECCAAYDVPPPVVHILDRATFSNITEQMRSMYRDTMAPHLKHLESTLEVQLRDGRMGEASDPDFGDEVYAEFLMDEVLRGAFEARAEAYQKAINSGWMEPAEVRELENLPFVGGSDQLFINSAVVPIGLADDVTPGAVAQGGDGANDPAGGGSRALEVADEVIARHLAGIESRRKALEEGDHG